MSKPLMMQKVSPVERARQPLEEIPMRNAIEQLVGGSIESCSDFAKSVVGQRLVRPNDDLSAAERFRQLVRSKGLVHPFVGAVHQAYADHRPLVLSPDMFWLLVTQGIALHINNQPDDYRGQFGASAEKEIIEVRHDGLCKGALENPWEEVFDQLSFQIRDRIGEQNHAAIVTEFSTTSRVEKAAFEIVLMECVKSFFEFSVRSRCGIPEVVLEGEAGDWTRLREKTETLGTTFNVKWWTDELVPTLDQIAENAAGEDNPQLWENIYKRVDGSGGPFLSGWILKFFPYLGKNKPTLNPMFLDADSQQEWLVQTSRRGNSSYGNRSGVVDEEIQRKESSAVYHITTESLPSSLCKVPFIWQYVGETYKMEFLAGFTGFTQDSESLHVRPKIGWAVREIDGEQNHHSNSPPQTAIP